MKYYILVIHTPMLRIIGLKHLRIESPLSLEYQIANADNNSLEMLTLLHTAQY